jgi:predicted nucleic acid-binding protein
MRVLVDTCVWSHVLRRRDPDPVLGERLKDLIADGRAMMIGPIRQELLSGVSDPRRFRRLRDRLAAFEDIALRTDHFVRAAEFCNVCRAEGIQGSTIDFLICAVAVLENLMIFTTDKDFETYRRRLPIRLIS